MSTPDKGYWWCPHCSEEVGVWHVTYQEFHEACGRPVEWVAYSPTECRHCSATTVSVTDTAIGNMLVCRTCGAVDREEA